MMAARRFVLFLALVGGSTGCDEYILIRSRLIDSMRLTAAPEITSGPQYFERVTNVRQVALRAPDSCQQDTDAQATGSARNTTAIVRSDCGVWMSEIERALLKAGYSVISWRTLNDAIAADHVSPNAAAQKLGAHILFQVNSLEKVRLSPGQDARWERHFFVSDAQGHQKRAALVEERRAAGLRRVANQAEERYAHNERLGAMLNVNAVLARTGQTVWFYRWMKAEPLEQDEIISVLAKLEDDDDDKDEEQWSQVSPEREDAANDRDRIVRSGETEAISVGSRPASASDAVYFQLVQDVVNDFVTQFARGNSVH